MAFDPPLQAGEEVVVGMGDRRAYGTVSRTIPILDAKRQPSDGSRQRVIRRATKKDVTQRLKQQQRERDALRIAAIKIAERGLAMKLVRVEQQFDGSRLIFYFTADGRIDFRELVRELAAEFRSRIEMRQIGVRDEARLLGGYGTCGRPLCCTTWLQGFEPISIKMAKQAAPEPQSVPPVRAVWASQVLPAVRTPKRGRRAICGVCQRGEL